MMLTTASTIFAEFENWYNETFLSSPPEGQTEPTAIDLGYGRRRGLTNLKIAELKVVQN